MLSASHDSHSFSGLAWTFKFQKWSDLETNCIIYRSKLQLKTGIVSGRSEYICAYSLCISFCYTAYFHCFFHNFLIVSSLNMKSYYIHFPTQFLKALYGPFLTVLSLWVRFYDLQPVAFCVE